MKTIRNQLKYPIGLQLPMLHINNWSKIGALEWWYVQILRKRVKTAKSNNSNNKN